MRAKTIVNQHERSRTLRQRSHAETVAMAGQWDDSETVESRRGTGSGGAFDGSART